MARNKKEMKAGDLVTLSSVAFKRNFIWFHCGHDVDNMVGMITRVKDVHYSDGHYYKDHRRTGYVVKWLGPEGEKNGPPGRRRWDKYFLRSDLKFFSKKKYFERQRQLQEDD